MDQEVKNAKLLDSLVCLELDANAKLGRSIIADDPNEMSKNGELLIDFVMRNNLMICNASEKCQGTITRQRTTVSGTEKSVLDYLIVCQDMYTLLDSVKIDDKRALTLSRYLNKSGNTIVTKSDHNIIQAKFDLKWCRQKHMKNVRTEVFNFKNTDGIQKFKELTSGSTLSSCFKGGDVVKESNHWLKEFNNILQRSFKKIRLTSRNTQNEEIVVLMQSKAKLITQIKKLEKCLEVCGEKIFQKIANHVIKLESEVEQTDRLISALISDRNAQKIRNHFDDLMVSGKFSAASMWSIKKKLNLSAKGAENPIAKVDKVGNLATTKPGLLNLYRQTYIDRLAPKMAGKDYEDLHNLKKSLFDTRVLISSADKSDDWTCDQIVKVCKSSMNGKARDQNGLVYELFKPPYAGMDVYISLTKMFNQIKEQLKVPRFFENMKITSIYKNKGSKSDLSNDRGIFNVSKLRSLLDKLIYTDVYPIIDQNMSCSNVGGRKKRNIRDHLFVIFGVINDMATTFPNVSMRCPTRRPTMIFGM